MSVRIVILCEDIQQDVFVRYFLENRNFSTRDFTRKICPSGLQSGEQWVRTNFATELKAIRERQNAYLIVLIDADNKTVEERRRQLNEACREADVAIPNDDDPVLFIIPKRNIETWCAYLKDNEVDELTEYPKYPRESECRKEVDALYEMCKKQNLKQPAPPSLEVACNEYPKLKK